MATSRACPRQGRCRRRWLHHTIIEWSVFWGSALRNPARRLRLPPQQGTRPLSQMLTQALAVPLARIGRIALDGFAQPPTRSRDPGSGPGWTEVMISPRMACATSCVAQAVTAGFSVLLLHDLASSTECETLRAEASGVAQASRRRTVAWKQALLDDVPEEMVEVTPQHVSNNSSSDAKRHCCSLARSTVASRTCGSLLKFGCPSSRCSAPSPRASATACSYEAWHACTLRSRHSCPVSLGNSG